MMLGADPEFFLQDRETGKIVAASTAGLANGKYDPDVRWKDERDAVQVYRDGYGAEVNFTIPHYCRGLMGNAFKAAMVEILGSKLQKYNLLTTPAVPVDLEEISMLPADVAQFGCAPSLNAWGEKLDITSVNGLTHPWRYIGGHMWVSNSYDECPWLASEEGVEKYVRALDYYLGLPLTYIFERPEAFKRREMYGRAGDYRVKQFNIRNKGVEYRTPSPEWFNHTAWFSFVLGVARFLSTRFQYINHEGIKARGPAIQAAINTGKDLEALLPPRLFGFYTKEALQACRETKDKFLFQFHQCPDTHSGWDYWSKAWRLPGDWDRGSSLEFKLSA